MFMYNLTVTYLDIYIYIYRHVYIYVYIYIIYFVEMGTAWPGLVLWPADQDAMLHPYARRCQSASVASFPPPLARHTARGFL